MTMKMVAKVARVLEPQAWAALGTGDTLAYKNRRTSSLRKARAAILEMREPTDEMVKSALIERRARGAAEYHDVAAEYRRMIDKALETDE